MTEEYDFPGFFDIIFRSQRYDGEATNRYSFDGNLSYGTSREREILEQVIETCAQEYEKWSEGERPDWQAIKYRCETMVQTINKNKLGQGKDAEWFSEDYDPDSLQA